MAEHDAPTDIQLLVLDVDGVLTDGHVNLDNHGNEFKSFHARDGLAIRMWMRAGHEIAIITGRASMALQHRMDELGVRHVLQGVTDKQAVFGHLVNDLALTASQTAVMGDDLPDLPMLRLAGYPMAVADAVPEVRAVAEFVTLRPGGHAAVREAIEHLLKSQEMWEQVLQWYH